MQATTLVVHVGGSQWNRFNICLHTKWLSGTNIGFNEYFHMLQKHTLDIHFEGLIFLLVWNQMWKRSVQRLLTGILRAQGKNEEAMGLDLEYNVHKFHLKERTQISYIFSFVLFYICW